MSSSRTMCGSRTFKRWLECLGCGWLCLAATVASAQSPTSIVIVVGAGGEKQYEENFEKWANQWEQLAQRASASLTRIDATSDDPYQLMQQAVAQQAAIGTPDPLWIVLLGHGTFDGKQAKFNLRGPDVAADELAQWLSPAQRPLVIVNCSSSSGPFINALTGPQRVVITATKSGLEVNYARFGEYFVEALADASSDLDKDEQVSALEAFVSATGRVQEFYESEQRLATEHALLDDNGDGLGTPGEWFRGVRAIRAARDGAPLDGLLARQTHLWRTPQELQLSDEQRVERDTLENEIEALRQRKASLPEDRYYDELEGLLLRLGRIYETAAAANTPAASDSGADESATERSTEAPQ